MLEECTTKEQRSVVRSLWGKGLDAKDIHKEIFPIYGGKCLSHKAVHKGVHKHGKHFVDEDGETKVHKWLRQQSKDLYMLRVSTHL
jgi:hypothetical protein